MSEDGKPRILNKKGAYVLDQQKIKLQKDKATTQASLSALLSAVSPSVEPTSTDDDPVDPSPDPTVPSSQVHFEALRMALAHL